MTWENQGKILLDLAVAAGQIRQKNAFGKTARSSRFLSFSVSLVRKQRVDSLILLPSERAWLTCYLIKNGQ